MTALGLGGILAGGVRAATPILCAALGETIAERTGVINLGLEGIMLVGALIGAAVSFWTGSPVIALISAIAGGALFAGLHVILSVTLVANQFISGVALIIFGSGLTSVLGKGLVGKQIEGIGPLPIPVLADLPVVGRVLFSHDALTYAIYLCVPFVWWVMYRSRVGLVIRAVGDDPWASQRAGFNVKWIRAGAVLFGGALAGLGGAYLSLSYTHLWLENMVSGRGLIALAVVIFGMWHPGKVILAALFFGIMTSFQLRLQAAGADISPYLLDMIPYIATCLALIYATVRLRHRADAMPRALAQPFRVTDC